MSAIITAQNVHFAFGEGNLRKPILFDVSFTIQPGEIVLLTGPSGSGKTTLLTLVGGLRSLREGRLQVLGEELKAASAPTLTQVRRRIGFIFQKHQLLGYLTARQNVMMSLQLNPTIPAHERSTRAAAMLEQVGLAHDADCLPAKLSGGQQQRVAIARALAGRPELILADEPTAALDGATGREIVNLLRQLAREQHCPILMVTHDPRILDIADRLLHMEDGRLHAASK